MRFSADQIMFRQSFGREKHPLLMTPNGLATTMTISCCTQRTRTSGDRIVLREQKDRTPIIQIQIMIHEGLGTRLLTRATRRERNDRIFGIRSSIPTQVRKCFRATQSPGDATKRPMPKTSVTNCCTGAKTERLDLPGSNGSSTQQKLWFQEVCGCMKK